MQHIQLSVAPKTVALDSELRKVVASHMGLRPEDISSVQIRKRSIDARQKHIRINLSLDVYMQGESPIADDFSDLQYPDVSSAPLAIVVGAGPAGLFAALRLIELGIRPIVLERGQEVMSRRRTLAQLHKTGIVDSETNYSFGEGGAGAFSDGKLYTRSKKRGSVERILRIFCRHGADPKILVDAHPHIGTDRLPLIIKRIREQIIASGGEVRFECRMDRLLIEQGRVRGVVTSRGEEIESPAVLLAVGHSARDVYRQLHTDGVQLEAKPIAVGVRLEHPQLLIDQIRYHSPKGRGDYLPAAEYTYKAQVAGRGVYSFCMCPGGFVVPASTAPEQTVVNGMSPANRGSKWANSGMVVEFRLEDLPRMGYTIEDPSSPLAMMEWCGQYEHQSYLAANKSLRAPAQRLTDFIARRSSTTAPMTSYNLGLTPQNFHDWMPQPIAEGLHRAFQAFEKMTPGFLTEEAQLIGVESRTSAPVRIPRQDQGERSYQHLHVSGLYPVGEGAGYAGGIVSAAIDGENAASALAEQFARL